MSRAIFKREASARKTTGVLLSPSDRMIPARILYRKVHGIPQNMMTI